MGNRWTNTELQYLNRMIRSGIPWPEIGKRIPRHGLGSIKTTAINHGFVPKRGTRILATIKDHIYKTGYRWRI